MSALDDRESSLSEEGAFPPARPEMQVVCRLQRKIRQRCVRSGRGVSVVDYGQKAASGLEKVYVTIASLNFDDAQTVEERRERPREGGEVGRASHWTRELASRSFASRRGEEAELSDLGTLFRGADGEKVDSCLVVGPAGTGKTVLLEWIMASWAAGGVEELGEFEIVVYVSGRDGAALGCDMPVEMLGCVLQREHSLSDDERREVETYLSINSQRVLVLLDSADEGGDAWMNSKALAMLFDRRDLAGCTFVATSRPCMLAYDLVLSCRQRYYMIGFNDRQLDRLLVRRLGEEEGPRVAEQLRAKPELLLVRELMKDTPLVANMVAELAERGAESLPASTTHIYRALALDIVRHEQVMGDEALSPEDEATDELAEQCQAWLCELGRLALDGFLQRRFVFDMDTVRSTCSEGAVRLGFLDEFEVETIGGGAHQHAEFRHLTWQEFFAAFSLCCDSGSDCIAAIRSCAAVVGVEEETEPFWRFVCGLVSPRHLQGVMQIQQAAYAKTCRSQSELEASAHWVRLACDCIAEAAQQVVSDSLLEENCVLVQRAAAAVVPRKISTRFSRLSTADALMLSLTLCHSPHVNILDLSASGLTAPRGRALGLGLAFVVQVGLSGNPGLHGQGLLSLANAIDQCGAPNLQTLGVQNCGIWGETDCAAIACLLQAVPSLRKLRLGQNYLGGPSFTKLHEPLAKSQLTVLDLNDNELDGEACCVLADIIASSHHLKDLQLHDNALGNHGVASVLKGIERSCSLELVDFSRTGVDDGVMDAILTCVSQRCTLQSETGRRPSVQLTFDGNKLSGGALAMFAIQMPRISADAIFWNIICVKTGRLVRRSFRSHFEEYVSERMVGMLSLAQEGVDDEGAEEVAALLSTSPAVRGLDLNENSVGDDGTAALGATLRGNVGLRVLQLTRNRVGPTGFASLVTSLVSNSTLVIVDFFRNPIFSAAVTAEQRESLHSALRQLAGMPSVRRCLLLGSTQLGDEECEVIGEALTYDRCSLVYFYLNGNRVTDEGAAALCSGLERNSSVKYVDVSDNKITNVGAERIRRCTELRAERGLPIQVWMEGNPADPSAYNNCMINRVSGRLAMARMIENVKVK